MDVFHRFHYRQNCARRAQKLCLMCDVCLLRCSLPVISWFFSEPPYCLFLFPAPQTLNKQENFPELVGFHSDISSKLRGDSTRVCGKARGGGRPLKCMLSKTLMAKILSDVSSAPHQIPPPTKLCDFPSMGDRGDFFFLF